MSDLIFKTDGKETSRIPPLTIENLTLGIKCPETNLEMKMNEIEKVKGEIKVLEKKLALLEELEKTKTPVEEAYKDWWGQYPELETDSKYDDMRWQGFQAGYELAQVKDGCPEPPDEPELPLVPEDCED